MKYTLLLCLLASGCFIQEPSRIAFNNTDGSDFYADNTHYDSLGDFVDSGVETAFLDIADDRVPSSVATDKKEMHDNSSLKEDLEYLTISLLGEDSRDDANKVQFASLKKKDDDFNNVANIIPRSKSHSMRGLIVADNSTIYKAKDDKMFLSWPVTNQLHGLHSKLAYNKNGNGIDINSTDGASVNASADGIILNVDISGGIISIKHKDGIITKYANVDNIMVAKGQNVDRGYVIGIIDGSRLSFNVSRNNVGVDPLKYLLH